MPEGDLHVEVGPKPKLNPRSCANKEDKGKSLHSASAAADYIPRINFMYPASVEYLNRQLIIPELRRWTLGANVDLGLLSATDWFLIFMFILV